MDEMTYLEDLSRRPLLARMLGYLKLTGPGYMQSAMTLGSGTIGACVLMGSMFGYELLWVQPVAILLGVAVLAAVAKQTTHTGEKPYDAFWNRLHPALAIFWGISALVATVLWHIPQYSLTANGVVEVLGGAGSAMDGTPGRLMIGVMVLAAAVCVVYLYNSGSTRGLYFYELAVKLLVWSIVIAFAIVALSTGIQWKELFLGFTGISTLRDLTDGDGLNPAAIKPIVGGLAAAVGINMVFLYPYSLLNKGWGRQHKELAYFDLLSGMVVPFLIATTFIIVAVANTPGVGGTGQAANDIRAIIPVVSDILGERLAVLLLGFGMFAVGFSTIITHMLASGFIGCELFGFEQKGSARMWFSLLPAVGIVGVVMKFPFVAAVTASTLASLLMPAAVIGFVILLNMRSYMGDAMPRGLKRLAWNTALCASVFALTVGGLLALQKNWQDLQGWLRPVAQAAELDKTSAVDAAPETQESATLAEEHPGAYAFRHNAMGTYFEIRIYPPQPGMLEEDVRPMVESAWEAIDALEQQISNWIPESPLSEVNRYAGERPVKTSSDVMNLLLLSKEVFDATEGAFDPTVGPLLKLWGFYKKEGHYPDEEELARAVAQVGMDQVKVDVREGTVRFGRPGMQVDFGGIGKGYALDVAAAILREQGVTSALLHSGTSTVLAIGAPPGEAGWTVRVEEPYNSEKKLLASVEIKDEAFDTSSGTERFFEIAGKRYIHIFDPRTGRPVEEVLSAHAITSNGALVDALGTAFVVMGPEKTKAYCEKHPEVRAILVLPGPNDTIETIRYNF